MADVVGIFIVDASSIVRAALTDGSAAARLLDIFLDRGLFISSAAILDEVDEVLKRPKFRQRRSEAWMQAFSLRIRTAARLVVPEIVVQECRDPSDDKYLEAACAAIVAGNSNEVVIIVSDDQDLLALDPWRAKIRIVKPEAVLAGLGNAI